MIIADDNLERSRVRKPFDFDQISKFYRSFGQGVWFHDLFYT